MLLFLPTFLCCSHLFAQLTECVEVLLYTLVLVCVWQVSGVPRVKQECLCEVVFMNPVKLVLTNCTLTVSGSGLLKGELECQ